MTAYYNEFDPSAAEWLRELIKGGHIASGVVDERSILDVRPEDLFEFTQCHFFAGIGGWSLALRLAGWPDDRPVWTGSPPCQPFSVAGENKGQDDERHLAPKFISLVGACRPGVLFGEQVASAAVFGKIAKRTRNGTEKAPDWAWLDDLSDRLEGTRYAVGAVDFPSAGVDAPHIRQRTYFGAVDTLGLGHSGGPGLERHGGHGRNEPEPGRIDTQPDGPTRPTSATERLADSARSGRGEKCQDNGRRSAGDSAQGVATGHGTGGSDFGLAESNSRELCRVSEYGEHVTDRAQGGRLKGNSQLAGNCQADRADPFDSFWTDPDWLFCRDGKWRPVEPGTFPLANGVPGRVGLLRGYGNAINPQQAAVFIEAFCNVT